MADGALTVLDNVANRLISGKLAPTGSASSSTARKSTAVTTGGSNAPERGRNGQLRQFVNLDGESFDLSAPRGSYVDVYA